MGVAPLRIGELLLSRGLCSRTQLLEAWEQKVIYGDRLGTNLLALGHIDEATLAQALGAQHGVHSGHGKVLNPQKEALSLVPKNVCEKRFVVPHHIAERSLYLLMRDPHDATAIDEVRFASGLRVVPVVACEARIWQLLERHYLARISMRPIPLDGFVRTRPKPVFEDDTATIGAELTSEEDFNALYASLMSGGVPPPVAAPVPNAVDVNPAMLKDTIPARPSVKAGAVLAPPRDASDDLLDDDRPYEMLVDEQEHESWRDTVEKTNPMFARARSSDAAPGVDDPLPLVDLVEAVPELEMPRQRTLDFHVDVQEPIDESPLTFDEAIKLLENVTDRTAIARIVLRASRAKFARACLLTVYADRFLGWQGIGDGLETEKLSDIIVPRGTKSVFELVADSRSHYLGPLARWPAHGAWVKATGRQIPRSVAVFPILVRGRPVNLLYADAGHNQFVSSDVGEVLILAQQIAGAYEKMIKTAVRS